MKNYCNFTNYIENGLNPDIFNNMSNERIKTVLDENFNDIEIYLNEFANAFKLLFNGEDYDDYYYNAKSLIEELNDIKIIINVLIERYIDE